MNTPENRNPQSTAEAEAALNRLRGLSLENAAAHLSAAERLVEQLAASSSTALRLKAHTELADAYRVNGRYDEALELLRTVGTEAAALEKPEAERVSARAHLYAAIVHDVVDSVAAGLEHAGRAAHLYRQLGDAAGLARTQLVTAGLHFRIEDFGEAQKACEDALSHYRATADGERAAIAGANLCLVHWRAERLEKAAEFGRDAVAAAEKPATRLLANLNLARVLVARGRLEEASGCLAEADRQRLVLGDPNYSGGYLLTRAEISRQRGRTREAQHMLEEFLDGEGAGRRPRSYIDAHRLLAEVHEAHGEFREALHYHRTYHELAVKEARRHAARQLDVRKWQLEVENARRQAELERGRSRRLEEQFSRLHAEHAQVTARAEAMKEDSFRDPLTGLANRRLLDERLTEAAAAGSEGSHRAALLMIDLDRFKRVNDRYGHMVGDAVLQVVARQLRRNVRSTDLCARFGGEEFVIVLDFSDAGADLERVAEKVRTAVSDYDWDSIAAGLELTCSVGAALFSEAGNDPEALLRLADRRLYRAKELGRNRVVAAD